MSKEKPGSMTEYLNLSDADKMKLLTRCEVCNKQCGTMAALIVHVRKYHPSVREAK